MTPPVDAAPQAPSAWNNGAANTLYESLGGQRSDAVMWDYGYADS